MLSKIWFHGRSGHPNCTLNHGNHGVVTYLWAKHKFLSYKWLAGLSSYQDSLVIMGSLVILENSSSKLCSSSKCSDSPCPLSGRTPISSAQLSSAQLSLAFCPMLWSFHKLNNLLLKDTISAISVRVPSTLRRFCKINELKKRVAN